MSPTPIALFTYNRPAYTRRVLTLLEACSRLDECSLYICCDAPRGPDHAEAVAVSRQIVHDWADAHPAHVIERGTNVGLARSIVEVVTELCEEHGRVIVLEDDLIFSPDLIDYMLQGLDRYQDEPAVYQISGFLFPARSEPLERAVLLPHTTTWGWATWERAWKAFDWNLPGTAEFLAVPQNRRRFNLDDSYPYMDMLEQALKGKVDSWGIRWWYTVFHRRGLVLYPPQTLVEHADYEQTGTHGGYEGFVSHDVRTVRLPKPLIFPERVMGDEQLLTDISAYLRRIRPQVAVKPGWVQRLKRLMPSKR